MVRESEEKSSEGEATTSKNNQGINEQGIRKNAKFQDLIYLKGSGKRNSEVYMGIWGSNFRIALMEE